MKIIIGFSRAKESWKIGSKIIAETEKRDYSHAYIRITDPITGVELVYQASLGMVNCYNFDLFKQHNVIVEEYCIETTEELFKDVLVFLHQNLGKPYSKIQILLLTIKKLFGFEVKYNNNNEEFICSELATKMILMVYSEANVNNLDYYTPSDLNKLVNELQIPKLINIL
jgi:hypothetical protein